MDKKNFGESCNSPNSPRFPPSKILYHTVYHFRILLLVSLLFVIRNDQSLLHFKFKIFSFLTFYSVVSLLHSTVLHSIVLLYSDTQYSDTQYSDTQYSDTQGSYMQTPYLLTFITSLLIDFIGLPSSPRNFRCCSFPITYGRLHIYTHIHAYTHTYTHIYTHIHTYIYMYVCRYIHTYTHSYITMYVIVLH